MADTVRILSALQTLLADNATREISPQDIRDFLVSAVPSTRTASFAANSGTATIVSGTTSIVVTHGLGVTPALKDLSLAPGTNTTNSVGLVWADTFTATQFTIHCEADPGASGLVVGWTLEVL